MTGSWKMQSPEAEAAHPREPKEKGLHREQVHFCQQKGARMHTFSHGPALGYKGET